jgi:hypothetical protein
MAATAPTIGTGIWTKIAGGAATITTPSSPTTTITGLSAGTYTFRWTVTNGACSAFDDVVITIVSGPTASNAGPDQSWCLATIVTLAGNSPVLGTGVWSKISGPAGAVITNAALNNTTVTGLVPGSYVFRWTISLAGCTSTTDDVTINIYDNPTVSNAGPDQTICGTTVTMAANVPAIGTGTWTKVSGTGGTITNVNLATTTITGLTPGTYIFRWTIASGPCPSSSDDVQVVVDPAPTTSNAGAVPSYGYGSLPAAEYRRYTG